MLYRRSEPSPVSSRLFRFDRTFGQPPDTASMNFDPLLSISCVTVSLVTLPFPSMFITSACPLWDFPRPWPLNPAGERPWQIGARPKTGATHANARPMAQQRPPDVGTRFQLARLGRVRSEGPRQGHQGRQVNVTQSRVITCADR